MEANYLFQNKPKEDPLDVDKQQQLEETEKTGVPAISTGSFDKTPQDSGEIERLYKSMQHLDQMKNNFIVHFSRVLRTPLSLICGPIEKLLLSEEDEERTKLLKMIQANAYILLKHVNDLHELFRLEANEMELTYTEIELHLFVARICSVFDDIANRRNITFERHLASVNVQIDIEKLEYCLLLVISNAFKFTPKDGHVTVRSTLLHDSIQIDVSDSGVGVPVQHRQHIFQRFKNLGDDSYKKNNGTSLGLVVAYESMVALRGSISILESTYNGALFRITFPKTAPNNTKIKSNQSTHSAENEKIAIQTYIEDKKKQFLYDLQAQLSCDTDSSSLKMAYLSTSDDIERSNKSTVLVIEDNVAMNQYVCSILQDYYHVISAADGEEGIAKISKYNPDCIITSILLSKLTGVELVEQIRANKEYNTIPIIILTAVVDDDLKVGILWKGAQDCITKPFKAEDLLARVTNLIITRRSWKTMQQVSEQQKLHIEELVDDVKTLISDEHMALSLNDKVFKSEAIN